MALRSRNNRLGLQISSSLLVRLCHRSTELQLLCLPQARKVAFYSVGPLPHLMITCIGATERNPETNEIKWRGSTEMDSEVSGKTWKDLLHFSIDDLDAWSSCLRTQKTWTSSGSKDDFRRLVEKSPIKLSDAHFHLEPVLMRKADLWDSMPSPSVYPRDRGGKPLWLNADSIAVALIKIHLAPETFPLDPSYWEITEKLTEGLAIQLLHVHSKQSLSGKMKMITEERNEIIEILIKQIREIMTKLGVVYRIIDNEVGSLRQAWEDLIYQYHSEQPHKDKIIEHLNLLLQNLDADLDTHSEGEIRKQLEWYQNKLSEFCFLPEENEVWFQQKIVPLWRSAASRFKSAPEMKKQIEKLLSGLEQSFHVGLNETLVNKIDSIPTSIKSRWTDLAYNAKDLTKGDLLQEYIHLLEQINIDLPNKRKTIENLLCLKSLALYIEDLESKLNEYFDKYATDILRRQIHSH